MRAPRTVQLDERLWDAVQRAASEDGVPEEDLIEEALRRYMGLRGMAVLDDIAERQRDQQMTEDQAMELAVAEIRAARAERHRARGA